MNISQMNIYSINPQPKPKLLVGLYGLPRTFEHTANNFFEALIIPNMDTYDITIMINTDFDCEP